MDGREFVAANADEFAKVSFGLVAGREPFEVLKSLAESGLAGFFPGAPLASVAIGLDADRIHAANEYVDLSRLPRGAETAVCVREELAAASTGLSQ